MRKWFVSLVLLVTLAGVVAAHEKQKHILGKVAAIGDNSITVETAGKEAKKMTVLVIPETKFQKSGSGASLKDLAVGERVVVHAKENKQKKLEAVLIIFGDPEQAKKQ